MQKAYIMALYDLMKNDPKVLSLLSDSGTDYDILLARDFPKQCFNFGIMEQNKVAAASGMAAMGKIPFVYTTGSFLAYRAYEFIRDDVCFQKRNVKLVGLGMGFGLGQWSTLGVSHHSTEDIAVLRALPNMVLMSASTPIQLEKMVKAAYEHEGPVYIRIGMNGEQELYQEDQQWELGKNNLLIEGNKYVVFSTGTILSEAYQAVTRLNLEGNQVALVDVSTLKPLDKKGILELSQGKSVVFTVEEHSVIGGLGSAVAEVLSEEGCPSPLKRIGLQDHFATGYGTLQQVRATNRLDTQEIYAQIKQLL